MKILQWIQRQIILISSVVQGKYFQILNQSFLCLINYWLKGGLRQLIFSIMLQSLMIGFKNMKKILRTPYQSALSFEAPWPHIDGLLRPKNCNFHSLYKLKCRGTDLEDFLIRGSLPLSPAQLSWWREGNEKSSRSVHFILMIYFIFLDGVNEGN